MTFHQMKLSSACIFYGALCRGKTLCRSVRSANRTVRGDERDLLLCFPDDRDWDIADPDGEILAQVAVLALFLRWSLVAVRRVVEGRP